MLTLKEEVNLEWELQTVHTGVFIKSPQIFVHIVFILLRSQRVNLSLVYPDLMNDLHTLIFKLTDLRFTCVIIQ